MIAAKAFRRLRGAEEREPGARPLHSQAWGSVTESAGLGRAAEYDRILRDLALIRAAYPELATVIDDMDYASFSISRAMTCR